MDTKIRSFIKAYSWRICGSCITFCISYAVTGKVVTSSTISGTELLVKPFFYWLHERGWTRVKWGKHVQDKEVCKLRPESIQSSGRYSSFCVLRKLWASVSTHSF